MSAEFRVNFEFIGYKDFERVMKKSLLDIGSDEKIYTDSIKRAAQRTTIRAARANYRALGKSGSLATAMRAYRWKRDNGQYKYVVHAGPKRSIASALLKYLAYWKKNPSPNTFKYGIRHAHLVEYGHKTGGFVGAGGRVPGKRILERSWAQSNSAFVREFRAAWGPIIDREVARQMRKRTRQKLRLRR